jgi:hypothetical protein
MFYSTGPIGRLQWKQESQLKYRKQSFSLTHSKIGCFAVKVFNFLLDSILLVKSSNFNGISLDSNYPSRGQCYKTFLSIIYGFS